MPLEYSLTTVTAVFLYPGVVQGVYKYIISWLCYRSKQSKYTRMFPARSKQKQDLMTQPNYGKINAVITIIVNQGVYNVLLLSVVIEVSKVDAQNQTIFQRHKTKMYENHVVLKYPWVWPQWPKYTQVEVHSVNNYDNIWRHHRSKPSTYARTFPTLLEQKIGLNEPTELC